MDMITYGLGVLTGFIIAGIIEYYTRPSSERVNPINKLGKKKGAILESRPFFDLEAYDSTRDTEDEVV